MFGTAVPVSCEVDDSQSSCDERSPLLRNSINVASNRLLIDTDVSVPSDGVGESATHSSPRDTNAGIV